MATKLNRGHHRQLPERERVVIVAGQRRAFSLDDQEGGEGIADPGVENERESGEDDSSNRTKRLDQIYRG